MTFGQARSSTGERFLDTEEAGGSIPPVPTLILMMNTCNRLSSMNRTHAAFAL